LILYFSFVFIGLYGWKLWWDSLNPWSLFPLSPSLVNLLNLTFFY
jgi:hypothetical protein